MLPPTPPQTTQDFALNKKLRLMLTLGKGRGRQAVSQSLLFLNFDVI